MARNVDPPPNLTGKDQPHDPGDAYFAKQWEWLQRDEEKQREAFRRYWLQWRKRNEGRARYTPWLVIPATTTDYGLRPLGGGVAHWASPFIGVISPDPSGKALAGAANTVWARVFNLGAATSAPTMVRFYWADPSVGLGADDAHPIGETMVEIGPMTSALVQCPTPWVPTYLNNGHECLFASADNPVLDPITAPFAPWADRHVGQRNVQVLPAVMQAMQMWLIGGPAAMMAELRVLALKVTVDRLPLLATPVATIGQVADLVLAGFGPLTRKAQDARLSHRVQRLAAEAVIAGHHLTGETRHAGGKAPRGPVAEAPDRWGEVLARFQTPPGVHQQLQVDFRALDLAGNEFVTLHFAWLVGGVVAGGYALTLAHPGWFKPGAKLPPETGGHMEHDKCDLRDLVIRNNPQAEATLAVATQLARHLPIESARDLCEGIKLGDAELSGELIAQLAAPLFPIRTPEELVTRVAAMLRIFVGYGNGNQACLDAGALRLLDRLEGHGDRPSMQMLVARGKPIFPLPPEKKEA